MVTTASLLSMASLSDSESFRLQVIRSVHDYDAWARDAS